MAEISPEKKSGCGLLNVVFGRKNLWPRRSTSTGSLQTQSPNHMTRNPSTPALKTRKKSLDEPPINSPNLKNGDRIIARPGPNHTRTKAPKNHAKNEAPVPKSTNGYNPARKSPQPALGLSGELDSMIADHLKSKPTGNLVRASSSNVMLLGNLGNLRQPGPVNNNNANSNDVLDHLPRPAKEEAVKYPTSVMGNVVVKKNEELRKVAKPVSLCRALSTRMDPEQLKIMGNEDYKNGRFAEAVALYDAAISIDPNKASYRSNKSAALTALGKLIEAAFECREAIRIDPFYQRAHNRLATLFIRLGEAEKALYHFKQSGSEADPDAMNKAKRVQIHLNKCTDSKRQRDWITLLKETSLSIEAGADSAPLIFGLRSEALLKLNRHQEAIETLDNGPNFDIDDCTKFFGPIWSASLSLFRAQVDMAAGRFDDAVEAAQRALRLDPNNREANGVLRRTKTVATARSNGNELFKVARYSEACIVYGEGLGHDPYNAVLLCNRAACRAKLNQYEKAIHDCSSALNVRSGYTKARLRRADCYAKMENWGACVKDCEVLLSENPDDEEVKKIMNEAKSSLEKNQDMTIAKRDSVGLVVLSSNERFTDYISSQGISLVLFCNKPGDSNILQMIEQLNQKYPSLNFLKVEVEDHPSLAKSEGVNSLPAFIIYTNGSRAKQIPGNNYDLLESSIKYYLHS